MAQELDPARLGCDCEDGQLAVAFGQWRNPDGASATPWATYCTDGLNLYGGLAGFVYVRIGVDRDRADTDDDDPALKFDQRAADNNGPG